MSGEDKASDWSSWDRRWGDSSLREQCDRGLKVRRDKQAQPGKDM